MAAAGLGIGPCTLRWPLEASDGTRPREEPMVAPVTRCQPPTSTARPEAVSVLTPRKHPQPPHHRRERRGSGHLLDGTRTDDALRYPSAPTDRQTEGASRQGRHGVVPVTDRRRAPRPCCQPTDCAQRQLLDALSPLTSRPGRCRCSHNRTRATEFLHVYECTRRVSRPARCMGVVSGGGVVEAKAAAPFTGDSETDQVRVDASALTRFSCSRRAGPATPLVEHGRLQVGDAKTPPARAGPESWLV